jgi:hypothetical protein
MLCVLVGKACRIYGRAVDVCLVYNRNCNGIVISESGIARLEVSGRVTRSGVANVAERGEE